MKALLAIVVVVSSVVTLVCMVPPSLVNDFLLKQEIIKNK